MRCQSAKLEAAQHTTNGSLPLSVGLPEIFKERTLRYHRSPLCQFRLTTDRHYRIQLSVPLPKVLTSIDIPAAATTLESMALIMIALLSLHMAQADLQLQDIARKISSLRGSARRMPMPTFEFGKDLLALHYDFAPDRDDGHSAALDRTILETEFSACHQIMRAVLCSCQCVVQAAIANSRTTCSP